MAKKIFLSPSNQTANRYASGGTTEAIQCGRIAEACKAALERCGFEVMLMHYYSMSEKVAKANSWGANLYIPIHTNAANGKVGGTHIFYYSTASAGYKAAQSIFNVLAPITPGSGSERISAYPGLYEVKHPNAPVAYVEADFHDVPSIAAWIIANVETIGEAICKGVCNYYGVKYVAKGDQDTDKDNESAGAYVVRVKDVPVYKACPEIAMTISGVYTIVEEKDGFGKLKSGAGWVQLNKTEKV